MTSCSGLFDFAAVDELKRLAAKYGKHLPQFSLRWTSSNPVVRTALVGFRTPAEAIENLDALGWDRLSLSHPLEDRSGRGVEDSRVDDVRAVGDAQRHRVASPR
jgi:aryl-alcohol dehydrogenase-like predicted oxidoreductase